MRTLDLARAAVRETDPKKFDEKMYAFLHALNHTEEGRILREIVQPQIIKACGFDKPLDE